MSRRSFVDSHAYLHAFVGNRLDRAVHLINDQSGAVLSDAGFEMAPQSASCLLFIADNGDASAADIAAALNLPHQVVTQRLNALLDLKLVARHADPKDGRRKLIRLTARGKKEFNRLRVILEDAHAIYDELNAELGVDISALMLRLMDSLEREPLAERILKRQAAQEKKAG